MTAVFLVSALLVAVGGLLLSLALGNGQRRRIRSRLATLGEAPAADHVPPTAAPLAAALRTAALDRHLEVLGWSPTRVALASGGALGLQFGLITLLDGFISAALATIVAVAAMTKALHLLATRARNRFADDLPLVMDRLRQLIMAGNGITLAFHKTLRACPPHTARLLAPVSLAVEHGMALSDALQQRAARLGAPDLFLLAAIVKTSTQFGGDFSAALKHLETVLSNRIRCRREIRALTSELRMTTFILLSLPVVTALGIFFANRAYIRFFVEAPQGLPALIYVGGSIAVGVVLVTRLSRVEY